MTIDKTVSLFEQNFDLISSTRAKRLDKRIRYLLARMYTGKGMLINVSDFDKIDFALSKKSGLITSMTKIVRQTISGLMVLDGFNSIGGIEELYFNYKLLRDSQFKSSSQTYFAAYQLFGCERTKRQAVVERASDLYHVMKERHPWITGTDDYSLIVSLAQAQSIKSLSPEEICDIQDYYFQELPAVGVRNHQALLMGSAILTMLTAKKRHDILRLIDEVAEELGEYGIIIKGTTYIPVILVAYVKLVDDYFNPQEISLYIETFDSSMKLLFEKDYKLALSLNLYIEEKIQSLTRSSVANYSLLVNHVIMQEQIIDASNITLSSELLN